MGVEGAGLGLNMTGGSVGVSSNLIFKWPIGWGCMKL